MARPARIGRSGAGRGAARVGVCVGPKWRGLRPAEGWAAVGGSGSVFEAIGLAAEEVTGIGSRSVRAGRGSGFVKGGAGVRREAGPVASTRLALKRAGKTFKTIAGAKRRRGTRVFEGGTKRGTLRGRWGERQRRVREEEVIGDVHERTTSGRGGSRGLGAVPTKRGGSRGPSSV